MSIEWLAAVFAFGVVIGMVIGVKIDRPTVHKIGKQKVKRGKGIFRNRQNDNSPSS